MRSATAFIGFGEAGMAFAAAAARGYDRRNDDAKRQDFARCGVRACGTAAEALSGASAALSLVTADQALSAALDDAPYLGPGTLWLDMNSVAPDTKRAARDAVEAAGGRYADVAVMSPVYPARLAVPLLISGPHAQAGADALAASGFTNVRIVAGPVGAASSIKMIRSVMIKGIEALSAECALAAHAAGVEGEVIASLDASWPGADWGKRFDYNLDRMLVHGCRRSDEMREVARTVSALGPSPTMSEGAASWQRALGELGIDPPAGLSAKVDAIRSAMKASRA